jgi:hypothetical protein
MRAGGVGDYRRSIVAKKSAELSKGSKVVASKSLPGVPEGTTGKVKIENGFTWKRYWVQFDNGVWMGSIDGGNLSTPDQWERRHETAAAAAAAAEAAPVAEATASNGGGDAPEAAAGGGSSSKVPAHLLERAKKAREKAAAKG